MSKSSTLTWQIPVSLACLLQRRLSSCCFKPSTSFLKESVQQT